MSLEKGKEKRKDWNICFCPDSNKICGEFLSLKCIFYSPLCMDVSQDCYKMVCVCVCVSGILLGCLMDFLNIFVGLEDRPGMRYHQHYFSYKHGEMIVQSRRLFGYCV